MFCQRSNFLKKLVFCIDIGTIDSNSWHSGMPVIAGTKYAATKWIRERGVVFCVVENLFCFTKKTDFFVCSFRITNEIVMTKYTI
jgi:hypothetical protein